MAPFVIGSRTMPLYVGKAGDQLGRTHPFAVEASDRQVLDRELMAIGQFPLQVDEIKRGILSWAFWSNVFEGVVSTTTVIGFTRALAVMLKGGIPLVEAILMATSREEDPDARQIFTALARNVERGQTFHESLAYYPAVFPADYVHSVMAGEKAGMLTRVLAELAEDMEKMKELRTRILLSLVYPAFLALVATVMVGLMMFFVAPRLTSLNEGSTVEAPLVTLLVMGARDWFLENLLLVAIFVGFGLYQLSRLVATEAGRKAIDARIQRIPLVGRALDTYRTVMLFRNLALMREAGLPLIEAMVMLEGSSASDSFRETVSRARRYLEYGNPVTYAFESTNLLDPSSLRILQAGEESGELDNALREVSETLEKNLVALVERLTGALPAVLLLFSAVVITVVLISVMVPMTQMIGNY